MKSISELISLATVPINVACDALCDHFHHVFCSGQFGSYEDWSQCDECDEPNLPDTDEDITPGARHADGDHEFIPKQNPQSWPLPQIGRLITHGIFVGMPSSKAEKVH